MFYIGIVTKDRVGPVSVLLKSVEKHIEKVTIVDASEKPSYEFLKDNINGAKKYIFNSFKNYKTVNHNKNILIHDFLKSSADYLFLIEDDIKILDSDVFQKYIDISSQYNIPHMNFILPRFEKHLVYDLNEDVQVCNILYGAFSFYTRKAIEKVGLFNKDLSHQCWEHIEHTARVHKAFNFQPEFFHFPDVKDSWEMIKYQKVPSVCNVEKSILDKDKQIMFKSLGWKNFPLESIKRLDITHKKLINKITN